METYKRGQRLKDLREAKGWSHAELGKELGKALHRKAIGKGTVWKWEQADSPDMELDIFFALADLYSVDARELATGKKTNSPALPPRRVALVNAYGRLPDEIREPIRGLIETLDTTLNPRYQAWSKKEAARAKQRDAVHETD